MANVSKINGFRPVKHLNGSPYNGQANIYEVPAGETIPVYVGDLVVLSDSAATAGYPACESAFGASSINTVSVFALLGAVVGILNTKIDPDGLLTTGSMSLDQPIYRPASTKQFVLVADSPDLIFEAQADASVANASVGLNTYPANGALSTTVGTSSQYVYTTTAVATTAALPLQIMGIVKKPDNEVGANSKILVRINTHAFTVATGSAGV